MDLYIPESLKTLLPEDLLGKCRTRPFTKGDYLFHQHAIPEFMFFIVSGEAVLCRASTYGGQTVLQRCQNGFLSEASLLTDVYHCDAIATQNGTSIAIPVNEFKAALEDPSFSLKWIRLLSREIMRLRTHSERLGLKDIKSKLIHLIETEGKQGVLTLRSDFKSLAAEIGSTHEALYRAIAHLETEKVLKKTPHSLQLLKPD